MVPRVAKVGRSFKGAALYYLHDKQAQTRDRVAFTETVNLPTMDADRGFAHMIDTATHANELKARSGIKATGRTLEKPVYCYSLAWHPTQTPTQEHQLETAHATIKALGLSEHQAIIVAHNDTKHPHVHIIVNRVHPDTGVAKVMGNDQLILSRWAEAYEKEHGKVFCQARPENNEERDKGNWRKDTKSQNAAQTYAWKREATDKLWEEFRTERDGAKANRQPLYDALWRQKEERFATRKAELKQLYKPLWRDLYKQQKKALRDYDGSMFKRIKFALTNYEKGKALAVWRAIENDQIQRMAFEKVQAGQRETLSDAQKQAVADAAREVTKAWKYDYEILKAAHKAEDQERLDHYKGLSDQIWKGGQDKGQEVTEAFKQAAPEQDQVKPVERKRSSRDILREDRERDEGRTRDRTRHRPRNKGPDEPR